MFQQVVKFAGQIAEKWKGSRMFFPLEPQPATLGENGGYCWIEHRSTHSF